MRLPRLALRTGRIALKAFHRDKMLFLASALSFDALLAAIPFSLLFITTLATVVDLLGRSAGGIAPLLEQFLPVPGPGLNDPVTRMEGVITAILESRGEISLYALPLFLLFSTRLFASLRVALNELLRIPPTGFWHGLGKDLILVLFTTVLFVANSLLTLPGFVPGFLDRFLSGVLALGFSLVLFFMAYSLASDYPMRWQTALGSASVAAVGFEGGKILFGEYLRQFVTIDRVISHANAIALLLFVFWIYYNALIFLGGGQVARVLSRANRSKSGDQT